MTHETSIIQRSEQSCLLSVVIPVYNVAPYVGKTLGSVVSAVRRLRASEVAERLPSLSVEVICVDDGSADGSGKILDAWAASVVSTDLSLKPIIIHQANVGVSAARNAALDIATGEWVMMLDGDDTWDDSLLVQLFSQVSCYSECDMVCFRCVCVDGAGNIVHSHPHNCEMSYLSGDAVLFEGRGRYSSFIWGSCDKLIRRSLIERSGLRYRVGMRRMEDTLFSHQLLAYAQHVLLLPEVEGYRYLMRSSSAVHVRDTHLPDLPFIIFTEMLSVWRKTHGSGALRRLQLLATEAPTLACGTDYASEVRYQAIAFLLRDSVFNTQILPFMFWHGTWKSRVFAGVYKLLPLSVRRYVLVRIGGCRNVK